MSSDYLFAHARQGLVLAQDCAEMPSRVWAKPLDWVGPAADSHEEKLHESVRRVQTLGVQVQAAALIFRECAQVVEHRQADSRQCVAHPEYHFGLGRVGAGADILDAAAGRSDPISRGTVGAFPVFVALNHPRGAQAWPSAPAISLVPGVN